MTAGLEPDLKIQEKRSPVIGHLTVSIVQVAFVLIRHDVINYKSNHTTSDLDGSIIVYRLLNHLKCRTFCNLKLFYWHKTTATTDGYTERRPIQPINHKDYSRVGVGNCFLVGLWVFRLSRFSSLSLDNKAAAPFICSLCHRLSFVLFVWCCCRSFSIDHEFLSLTCQTGTPCQPTLARGNPHLCQDGRLASLL